MSAPSPSVILAQRDVDFLLYEWLRVEELTSHSRYADHSREVFDAVLGLARSLAHDYYRPHNQASDASEPVFDGERVHLIPEIRQALDAFAESGLLGSSMDARVGGDQLPHVVARACSAWLQAANAATSNYHLLSAGNANLLAHYGTPEQIDRFVRPIIAGRFTGTMCLSEPQAGSSLSDVQTRAVPDLDGSYRLFGSKMWISGGDHDLADNIVHLVLARTEGAPPGVKGLSLFIVPRHLVGDDGSLGPHNDVVLAGINHKMGQRGCVNTVLNFGEGRHPVDARPGAVGYLVGDEGRGLEYMFQMMNEARIAVGSMAVALGYTGYLESLAYARTRTQGRLPSAKDPRQPQTEIIHHPDVRRMLLAQKAYAEGGLALVLYVAHLLDRIAVADSPEEGERLGLLLDVLTPVVKAWPSQWCLKGNELAIQVLGGYGYTRDYPLEQHYRDNRLNPIHEGTDGIQSLDLLGRKVVMQDGRALRILAEEIEVTLDSVPDDLSGYAEQLRAALARLTRVTAALWSDGDPGTALANSFLYLEAFGHTVVAWIWLQQMIAADGQPGEFYDGKRLAGRYFFSYELPRIIPVLDILGSRDRLFADLDDTCL